MKKTSKLILSGLVCLGLGLFIGKAVSATASDTLPDKLVIEESPFGGNDANAETDIYLTPDGLMVEENGELVPYEASMKIEELLSLMEIGITK